MSASSLDLLVLTDTHFVAQARHACTEPRRHTTLGQVLVRKALARLHRTGVEPGLIVVLGDLVDDGSAADAELDLLALAGELRRTGIPVLAVPGNHDGQTDTLARIFNSPPGLHRVGDFGFLLFHDTPTTGEHYARDAAQLALPEQTAQRHPELTLVALQHHPLDPPIESSYPYLLDNAAAVLASYRAAGVRLSLSGHYHAGQPPHTRDGTDYLTAPALCESPFRFLHVHLEGREVRTTEHALRIAVPGLTDVHCHTEFAYCGTTVSAAHAIAISTALGLGTLCLVEHAFQLYFDRDEAWSFRWQQQPDRVAELFRTASRGRMAGYRAFANQLRSPFVRIGLEVELCADGNLLLAPPDAAGWDLLVGAIHEIPGYVRGVTSAAEAERLFLREVDRLTDHPIAVLAHPFRFFARKGLPKPEHIYPVVARRLAERGIAAEINFHTNQPELAFVRECRAQNVRLALGSDSHDLTEVAEFAPHLDLLAQAGIAPSARAGPWLP